MKMNWMSKLGLLGACLGASLASAQVCQLSNSSLFGPFGFAANQFLGAPFNPPGTGTTTTTTNPFSNTSLGSLISGVNSNGQFATTGVLFFDGAGQVSAMATPTSSTNTAVGTFNVNPDCTVTVTLKDVFGTNSTQLTLVGAILGNGSEIDFDTVNNSTTVSGSTGAQFIPGMSFRLVRQNSQNACSVGSLRGLYGFVINSFTSQPLNSGTNNGTFNQSTVVGYLNFDGAGNITANNQATIPAANSAASLQPTLQFAGTYKVNPDCSGSMTISNSAATSGNGAGSVGLTVNFIELGGAVTPLNPVPQQPSLLLTVANSTRTGVGYALPQ